MSENVQISLSQDQALVLFEFFARFQESSRLRLANNAEFVALSEVAAQIERSLAQPLLPDYAEMLAAAQTRLAANYEGEAPGLES